MKEVVIVAAKRSAIGKFGGSLRNCSAVEIGRQVLVHLLEEINLSADQVDEVFIGNVLSAGLGQNVARQVALKGGLDVSVPATTINQVCGSGLKAIMLAYQSIISGENDVVIAGGTENMSQAPHLSMEQRWGKKLGSTTLLDSLLVDGLQDAFEGYHMGITAENLADQYNITRSQQDLFACQSQNKAERANEAGKFKEEIVPLQVVQAGKEVIFEKDENIRYGQDVDSLGRLKPAFKNDGSVTAGNSSTLNDGAALLILMSLERANQLGLKSLARIVATGKAGVDPAVMGIGPIQSTLNALEKANLSIKEIDLIEANEAFAVQSLVVQNELGLVNNRLNVNGGAIALGHPIGCSGARIMVTLIHELIKRKGRYGLATLCIGGGQGNAVIVEAYNDNDFLS